MLIGTHMDAPAHCDTLGRTIGASPLQDCLAPCIVIDISDKADENYLCSVQDILDFEKQYRMIKSGDFVIIQTGWSRYWFQLWMVLFFVPSISKSMVFTEILAIARPSYFSADLHNERRSFDF